MFELIIKKEDLLPTLLSVAGAVDKKQARPILANFLLKLHDNKLFISATDLEIEMSAYVACESQQSSGMITLPAKKFIDIIKSLEDKTSPKIVYNQGIVVINEGRSSFKLATLPAEDFPSSEEACNEVELSIPRSDLLQLFQSTQFAMSQQDVRVFLNGLFLDFEHHLISAVATDGHRMAINRYACSNLVATKFLIPKKGVQEFVRWINKVQDE